LKDSLLLGLDVCHFCLFFVITVLSQQLQASRLPVK